MTDVLWAILAPDRFILWLLILGSILSVADRTRGWGRRFFLLGAGFFLLVTLLPIGEWMIRPLERRFPVASVDAPRVDGVVVLSGAERSASSIDLGQADLSESAERLTAFVALARRHEGARLVVSDGDSDPNGNPIRPATARLLFGDLGLDTSRVIWETRSRSTWENARFSSELVQRGSGETWFLVTSAFHMPRAVGVFRRVGWDVVPFPVDFRGQREIGFAFEPAGSLALLSTATKEWLALMVYRLRGLQQDLLPGPVPAPALQSGGRQGVLPNLSERRNTLIPNALRLPITRPTMLSCPPPRSSGPRTTRSDLVQARTSLS